MTEDQIDELIADFVMASKKQHEATMQGRWQEGNKYVRSISRSFRKIVQRGESAREALLAQIDNADLAVASMAAAYSLKYDTERSLAALQRIAKEPGIIGFSAKQTLMRWEEGDWHL
jgi:hypothetical protein